MSRYHLPILGLVAAFLVYTANSQGINTNSWHPDTRKLDLSAKIHDPAMGDVGGLARDVKRFYELLRDKQWHETYELRAKAFREDFPEANYIAEARRFEKRWGLVNYDVLSVGMENSCPGSTNMDEATLICRFIELPDYAESYSTVFWHKENGVWKCLSAGPKNLSIFGGTRAPMIDWR